MDRNPKTTIASALALIAWLAPQAQAESRPGATLNVEVDRSVFMRVPAGARTIAVGNPAIADALIAGENLILTGKSTGSTNLLAADGDGHLLLDVEIAVSPAESGVVRVYRGTRRGVLHCAPLCEPAAAPATPSTNQNRPDPVRVSSTNAAEQ
jgi:hypothetical protein